eukprot:9366134-Ditylum_brightwellii.AAC.1
MGIMSCLEDRRFPRSHWGLNACLSKVSWLTTEASRALVSQRPSCSMYGMSPCCMDYRSGYVEQCAETHASGLDPV